MLAKIFLALLLALGAAQTFSPSLQDDPLPGCQPGAPDCP